MGITRCVYISLHWVSKHLIRIHSKANHTLNTWTKNTVRRYSLHVPRCTVLFVIIIWPHVSSMHTMHYGNATLYAISLPGSQAPNNSLLLFPWLDTASWPKDCNYRPSMVHLIGITMKKRSRGENISDYKRLVGLLLLFSDGLVAAEWIYLPLIHALW